LGRSSSPAAHTPPLQRRRIPVPPRHRFLRSADSCSTQTSHGVLVRPRTSPVSMRTPNLDYPRRHWLPVTHIRSRSKVSVESRIYLNRGMGMSFGGKVIVPGGETSSFWKGSRGEAALPHRKTVPPTTSRKTSRKRERRPRRTAYLTILSYKRRGRRSYRDGVRVGAPARRENGINNTSMPRRRSLEPSSSSSRHRPHLRSSSQQTLLAQCLAVVSLECAREPFLPQYADPVR